MTASARLMLTYYWVALLFSHFVGSFQLHRTTSGQYGIITRLKVASADSEMNWDPKSGPKLDFNEDYYSVLDVESTVEAKELKKAYYKLVFKYHPDNIENESSKSLCNKQMMVINGAYRILKNINLRIMYDRQRRKGLVGAGAGIKESSVNNDGSKPITPPKSAQASEQQKAPPKTAAADPSAASKGYGKKYGSGFGGSWGSSNDKENDDFEQEYNEQERERERQRQRYQEPQPQTQRERDQQTRDRNQEFDFTYDQSGQYETPKRTPWGFNTNTYDEPVRPSEPYRESAYQRNGAEEYLRSAGRGVDDIIDSNLRGLKVRHFLDDI